MPAWSGFWNHTYTGGHTFQSRSQSVRRLIGRALHGYGRKPYNAVLRSLVNGAVGANARKDYTRVSHDPKAPTTFGGKRTIENKITINRATTANDVAIILDDLDFDNSPKPWPVDKSGNGGGSKRGF